MRRIKQHPLDHPEAGVLLDFAESRLDSGSSIAVSAHLEGCRRCRGKIEELRRLTAAIPGRHLEQPPEWLANWADDLPRLHPRPRPVENRPALARSVGAAPRRLVYRAGTSDLDLEIEPSAPGHVRLFGQILDGGAGTRKGAVKVLRGGRTIARATIDAEGRFSVERRPSGKSCTLLVETADLKLELPDFLP